MTFAVFVPVLDKFLILFCLLRVLPVCDFFLLLSCVVLGHLPGDLSVSCQRSTINNPSCEAPLVYTKVCMGNFKVSLQVSLHCSSDCVLSTGRCFRAEWILSGVASPIYQKITCNCIITLNTILFPANKMRVYLY